MLAMTLNEGERVMLFDDASGKLIGSVQVAEVRTARRVKISVDLPLSIRVLREECVRREPSSDRPPPPEVPWSEYRKSEKQVVRETGRVPMPAVPPPRNRLVSESTGRTWEVP